MAIPPDGEDALFSLGATGDTNTGIGYRALYNQTWGGGNTAVGYEALSSTGYAGGNTAVGKWALTHSTTGSANTAVGFSALLWNDSGLDNTATGNSALLRNIDGFGNTATGFGSLQTNSSGGYNTATGFNALFQDYLGNNNTATGCFALALNTASNNSAHGSRALASNRDGTRNAAEGADALYAGIGGDDNSAMGWSALYYCSGSRNIGLGSQAGSNLTNGSDDIDIANVGMTGESGAVRIGTPGVQTSVYVAGIRDSPFARGEAVAGGIDSHGRLGVRSSSIRYSDDIQPITKSSEAILALKPVTFRYKKALDAESTPQFGLVAEDVAKIDPDLVIKDGSGQPYTVRYEAVSAMLLNEFLKEHKKVKAQTAQLQSTASELERTKARLSVQEKEMAVLKAALAKQAGLLEKVSAQVQANPPAARLVENR